jgi:hypothetical protein
VLSLGERYWLTVVLAFGYTQSLEELREEVKFYINGSGGEIGKVIAVKIKP